MNDSPRIRSLSPWNQIVTVQSAFIPTKSKWEVFRATTPTEEYLTAQWSIFAIVKETENSQVCFQVSHSKETRNVFSCNEWYVEVSSISSSNVQKKSMFKNSSNAEKRSIIVSYSIFSRNKIIQDLLWYTKRHLKWRTAYSNNDMRLENVCCSRWISTQVVLL